MPECVIIIITLIMVIMLIIMAMAIGATTEPDAGSAGIFRKKLL